MDTINNKLRIVGNESTFDVCTSFTVVLVVKSMTVVIAQLTSYRIS